MTRLQAICISLIGEGFKRMIFERIFTGSKVKYWDRVSQIQKQMLTKFQADLEQAPIKCRSNAMNTPATKKF